ncbi:hypothetical protein FBU30_004934 [Linnemannia zychae]|nr:hypothetical protein FBU30_004934 [Linnemannia zychae]
MGPSATTIQATKAGVDFFRYRTYICRNNYDSNTYACADTISASGTVAIRDLEPDLLLAISLTAWYNSMYSAAVMIQACRSCRIEYYTLHPEPIPKRLDPFTWGDYEVLPRIDAQSAAYIYGLSAFGIRSLRFVNASQPRPSPLEYDSNRLMRLFHEPVVLQYARKIHGGDVGIAALHPDTPRTNWTCSDPKDDAAKQRQMLLRSLLYDKGLTPPPRSIACNTFVQSGHGDPIEIVKELDLENWLQCCTSYSNPYQDGSHQVKLRSNSDRRHQTMTASRPKKEKEDYHRSSHKNDEEGENEDREWYKLLVLDNWLMKRLRDGKFQSYKLDPAGPEKPPESAWPLIDKIDMGHIALVFAAQTIVKFLMTVRVDEGGMEEEYLDKLDMSIDQLKDVLDTSAKKKSLKDDDNSYTLSMLLESELGSGWDRLAIQRAKNLIQSQQM